MIKKKINVSIFYSFLFFLISLNNLYATKKSVREILLAGEITNPDNEISGMDWYKEQLYLLPENAIDHLFIIPKKQIQEYLLSKNPEAIIPKKIKLISPDYQSLINGFDGFEAIAFTDDNVILSIEVKTRNNNMTGYIAWGTCNPSTKELYFEKKNLKEVTTPIQIKNMAFESIIIHENDAILLYEANGENLQKNVKHSKISLDDYSLSKIDGFNVEYRITDATTLDSNNKFWCINYFWPGEKDKLKPGKDIYLEDHSNNNNLKSIERIIELEIKNGVISMTKTKPIQLFSENNASRNWEGIVRYGKNSFLVVTDKYPKMILGLVENN
jgi:hypothetical protein